MLRIEQLTKHYKGSNKGIQNISLEIKPGDIYAFIGHNGAGKTTTIKCIAGIHNYENGEIYIDGINIKDDPIGCKQNLAYIPDNPDLYEYLTGIQYLNFVADIYNISAEDRTNRIKEHADKFGITSSLGDLISTYSHGMKQKLAIISALVHDPKLLVLDEPFVGLDPEASLYLKNIMKEICQNNGAIFFSTHVLDVAERLCNKVAIIKDGSIIAKGAMDEIVKSGQSLEDVFMEALNNAEGN